MRVLIAISLSAALVSVGSLSYWAWHRPSPQTVVADAEPGVVSVSEPVIEFGQVGLNKDLTGSFEVINGSDQAITIGELAKSCSCTSAECSAKALAPGERATVKFVIRTGVRRGSRMESIAIRFTSAGVEQGEAVFAKVIFTPTGVFNVDPPEVTLTAANPKVEFRILSGATTPEHRVMMVEARNPCFKVDSSRLPVVVLELNPDVASEAIVNTECIIYTTVVDEEAISVPVRVRK